jgi:hypothetical protein
LSQGRDLTLNNHASVTTAELGHVELLSSGVAMLANGPDDEGHVADGGDISDAPFADMGASGSPRPSCPRAAVPPPLAATMRRGTTTS